MVDITLFFGVKGQTGLWLALVALLFSSMLCAQRVNVIDQKGTKASTGVEYTESATAPSSNLEGDLWLDISSSQSVLKVYSISAAGNASWIPLSSDPALDDLSDVTITNAANNEVLAYESGIWINKPLKDLKQIDIISSNNANPSTNPIIVGLSDSSNNSESRFQTIDETDIIILGNNNTFVSLESLNPSYHGKIITIVEEDDENPGIETIDEDGTVTKYYTATGNTIQTNSLYIMPYQYDTDVDFTNSSVTTKTIFRKYESVDFIWYNPTDADGNVSGGYWIPMR